MKDYSNWLTYIALDKQLAKLFSKYIHGRLIDIGCGIKPYKDMLAPFVTEHVGVDHEGTKHKNSTIDIYSSAYEIPVKDGSFDSCICTSVLEHLEDPINALNECNRVLKKRGLAVYSVPFIWPPHETPRDYYRFTKYGLIYLFEKTNFEILEISSISGFWGTFGQMLVYYILRFNKGLIRRMKIVHLLSFFLQSIFYVLDKIDKVESYTSHILIVVRKK